jgi:hypothetical protein
MSKVPILVELCFEVVITNLDSYTNLSEVLPVELKERIFCYYTAKIPSSPSPPPFPITSYPEDRYRDVQLVNRITCQRVIPLCFAMWSSLDYRFEKVKRLIEEEACDVNESDLEGFCPLHYAAIYGRVEACKLLLTHGADCTRKNNFGKTPADLAQDYRVQQMIKCKCFSLHNSSPLVSMHFPFKFVGCDLMGGSSLPLLQKYLLWQYVKYYCRSH